MDSDVNKAWPMYMYKVHVQCKAEQCKALRHNLARLMPWPLVAEPKVKTFGFQIKA